MAEMGLTHLPSLQKVVGVLCYRKKDSGWTLEVLRKSLP